ncbi:hypothetical protein FHX06_000026 [Rhizobium sp. BK512]|nr:hypothetical protein [Rhizobium sp. BK512]
MPTERDEIDALKRAIRKSGGDKVGPWGVRRQKRDPRTPPWEVSYDEYPNHWTYIRLIKDFFKIMRALFSRKNGA